MSSIFHSKKHFSQQETLFFHFPIFLHFVWIIKFTSLPVKNYKNKNECLPISIESIKKCFITFPLPQKLVFKPYLWYHISHLVSLMNITNMFDFVEYILKPQQQIKSILQILVCGKLQQREKNQDFISAIINTKKRNKH